MVYNENDIRIFFRAGWNSLLCFLVHLWVEINVSSKTLWVKALSWVLVWVAIQNLSKNAVISTVLEDSEQRLSCRWQRRRETFVRNKPPFSYVRFRVTFRVGKRLFLPSYSDKGLGYPSKRFLIFGQGAWKWENLQVWLCLLPFLFCA